MTPQERIEAIKALVQYVALVDSLALDIKYRNRAMCKLDNLIGSL